MFMIPNINHQTILLLQIYLGRDMLVHMDSTMLPIIYNIMKGSFLSQDVDYAQHISTVTSLLSPFIGNQPISYPGCTN